MSESEVVNLINACIKQIKPCLECSKLCFCDACYYIIHYHDDSASSWGLTLTKDLPNLHGVKAFKIFLRIGFNNSRLTEEQWLIAKRMRRALDSATSWEEVKMLATLNSWFPTQV